MISDKISYYLEKKYDNELKTPEEYSQMCEEYLKELDLLRKNANIEYIDNIKTFDWTKFKEGYYLIASPDIFTYNCFTNNLDIKCNPYAISSDGLTDFLEFITYNNETEEVTIYKFNQIFTKDEITDLIDYTNPKVKELEITLHKNNENNIEIYDERYKEIIGILTSEEGNWIIYPTDAKEDSYLLYREDAYIGQLLVNWIKDYISEE